MYEQCTTANNGITILFCFKVISSSIDLDLMTLSRFGYYLLVWNVFWQHKLENVKSLNVTEV